ncbi:Outer membrane protein assembly factor BamB, contains PQQ-like beta-propeller repeat [Singulisphaera sp. GP187]|uniref:outer membrane protein assembly factor BamB family protein n=1 Tax=Singulisphaera sp. GP187 TaxID=1882752 RepID=UPI0009297EFB|nr:PQQ-binding-like beta-propeller repeat protein [Singulisphaera sp. GP187]SIN68234.1 Outer membrane protein assembly factor BamB, contains PQQ-like beta-propeller repeat [Singulisphaera sp. GP187]
MKVVRFTIMTLLWFPALVLGQAKEDDPEKVTNDRPDRPLQMPPASSEVKEAFDDYDRFRRRGAWERALKSLYSIPDAQALRFVDGQKGFIIPVARKRRDVLGELSPEGQVAYRLFYDDEAKKLFDEAEGPTELKTLERIYSAYFPTTIGDNAADRLGDLYFEMGRFDRAADCWLAVLRERPDTDLSPALIAVKAALALARAGRQAEIVALRRDLADRYAGEKVTLGGQTAPAAEHLTRYLGEGTSKHQAAKDLAPAGSAGRSEAGPNLSKTIPAVWQMRFSESVVAGMTPAEQTQWHANPLSGAIPAVAVDGSRLYANFLGYIFALDLNTGKLIWRSASFHNLDIPATQNQARMINPARFTMVASKSHLWTLTRDLNDPNQMAPFRLVCRRTDDGDVVWQTTSLPDYAQVDLVGAPILVGGTLFVAAKTPMNQQQGQPQQYVLAIRAHDGKLLWKTEIGVSRQGQQYFYYGMSDTSPQPRLFHQAGAVYVDTHVGVLARLDAESGDLDWGYGYKTDPPDSMNRFFYRMTDTEPTTASSTPVRSGEALFAKGTKSEHIYAIDSDQMKLLWDRPIAKSARIVGVDDQALYLGGPELSALDLRTRKLVWATRVPGGSAENQVLVRPGGLWQLTPRGIFEINPKTGEVRRIFRGDDTGSDGGDLYLNGPLLLAVTNRTISAYPIVTPAAVAVGGVDAGPATPKTRISDD